MRFRSPILAGILVVLIPAAALAQVAKKAAPAADPIAAAERGARLAETGHCAEALPLLRKSFAVTPDKDLKLRVGFDAVRCSMTLNQPDLAVDFLRALNRNFPRSPEVLYLTVHIYSDLSTRASQDLLANAPNSYQAHQLNAESLEVQGRRDDAEREYRKVLEESPQTPGIHFRLGQIILSKAETPSSTEDARKEFQAELMVDPQNAGAEYVLGVLARQDQQIPEAIDHMTRATKLDAGFADAFLALGILQIGEKRYSDGIVALDHGKSPFSV